MARRPGAAVGITAALAGLLFVASAGAARGTDLRQEIGGDLRGLVGAEQGRVGALNTTVGQLRRRVDELSGVRGASDGRARQADAQAAAYGAGAAMTEVSGAGLSVTLDDAPADAATRARAGDLNYLVVHQQDVQAVVNALWRGGAQGVTLMDRRLATTSSYRCVGNTLSIDGTPYSPPYTITAVGDPDRLQSALDDDPLVRSYREWVTAYNLGWQVQRRDEVTLPPYDGPSSLRYAAPVPAGGSATPAPSVTRRPGEGS